jgi:hypothetical protein
MTPVDRILGLLQGVRKSGRGWSARCPAHEDRSASLSLAEGDDGRVLLRCFAGCGAADVVGALGLSLGDLFPERLAPATPEARRANREALALASVRASAAVLDVEGGVVAAFAEGRRSGAPIEPENLGRFLTACARIEAARAALQKEIRL